MISHLSHWLGVNVASPGNTSPKNVPIRNRKLAIETLESRRLLTVTAAEYADLCAAYPDFDLPALSDGAIPPATST